jgi:hypothetical protein
MTWSGHARNKKLAQNFDQKTPKVDFARQTLIWTAGGRLSIDLKIRFFWDVTQCLLIYIPDLLNSQ